jgi:hypothetical protein
MEPVRWKPWTALLGGAALFAYSNILPNGYSRATLVVSVSEPLG